MMKQKRKSKNGYRLSNKRLLIVAIGLLVILILAVANIAYMVNYRMSGDRQTATPLGITNEAIARLEAQTATQSAIYIATQTTEAP